jgi:antitoxin VapB
VSLNIKNERTHALVRELAALTGTNQTSAIEDAVRRRLEELRGEGQRHDRGRPRPDYTPEEVERRRADLRRIRAGFLAETTPEQRQAMRDHGDWLYDENGLPA